MTEMPIHRRRYFTAAGEVRFGRMVSVNSPWATDLLPFAVRMFVQSCICVSPHKRVGCGKWMDAHMHA
jgi:hypothetical protein